MGTFVVRVQIKLLNFSTLVLRDIGAIQNRLAFTVSSANNAIENIQASESSIRDADVAAEISEFTRAQILTQAATSVLAQANAIPQSALSLLQ